MTSRLGGRLVAQRLSETAASRIILELPVGSNGEVPGRDVQRDGFGLLGSGLQPHVAVARSQGLFFQEPEQPSAHGLPPVGWGHIHALEFGLVRGETPEAATANRHSVRHRQDETSVRRVEDRSVDGSRSFRSVAFRRLGQHGVFESLGPTIGQRHPDQDQVVSVGSPGHHPILPNRPTLGNVSMGVGPASTVRPEARGMGLRLRWLCGLFTRMHVGGRNG